MKTKLKNFSKKIGTGLKQEYHETKQIPLHIKNKNFKEAINQIGDLGKMGLIDYQRVLCLVVLSLSTLKRSVLVLFEKKRTNSVRMKLVH